MHAFFKYMHYINLYKRKGGRICSPKIINGNYPLSQDDDNTKLNCKRLFNFQNQFNSLHPYIFCLKRIPPIRYSVVIHELSSFYLLTLFVNSLTEKPATILPIEIFLFKTLYILVVRTNHEWGSGNVWHSHYKWLIKS